MPAETPAASAAPESTSSIIETAIADLPDSPEMPDFGVVDEPSEPSPSATSAATSTAATASGTPSTSAPDAETKPVTQADVDELARELGIAATGTAKWTTRVAYSKLHKVIQARDAKMKADHEAAVKQHTDRIAAYEQAVQQFDRLVANPEQLLASLAQVHPAYARFAHPGSTAAAAGVPQQINTMADLQRVIDAHVAARLQPIEQERAGRLAIEQAIPRVKKQLEEAEKWPLFTESKAEILANLKANPGVTLEQAYQKAVLPKLAAQRDTIRQEVLAELNGRPHSTTVTSTVTGRTAPDAGPMDTADIVAEAVRRLK